MVAKREYPKAEQTPEPPANVGVPDVGPIVPKRPEPLDVTVGAKMDFSEALYALKAGGKVAREGWNGKGMFIFLVQGSTFQVNRAPLIGFYPEGTTINYCPHIDMKAVDGTIGVWVASHSDLMADDWVHV